MTARVLLLCIAILGTMPHLWSNLPPWGHAWITEQKLGHLKNSDRQAGAEQLILWQWIAGNSPQQSTADQLLGWLRDNLPYRYDVELLPTKALRIRLETNIDEAEEMVRLLTLQTECPDPWEIHTHHLKAQPQQKAWEIQIQWHLDKSKETPSHRPKSTAISGKRLESLLALPSPENEAKKNEVLWQRLGEPRWIHPCFQPISIVQQEESWMAFIRLEKEGKVIAWPTGENRTIEGISYQFQKRTAGRQDIWEFSSKASIYAFDSHFHIRWASEAVFQIQSPDGKQREILLKREWQSLPKTGFRWRLGTAQGPKPSLEKEALQ